MDLSRSNIGAKFRRLCRAGDTPSPSLVNYKYTSANDKYREVYPTPSADISKFDDWGMIYVFNIDRYFDKHYPRAHIWIGVDISFPFPSTRRKVSSTNSSTLWNSVNRGKKAKEKKKKKKKTLETALFTGTMSEIHPREKYSLENRRRLLDLLSRGTPRIGHFLYYIPYFLSTKLS